MFWGGLNYPGPLGTQQSQSLSVAIEFNLELLSSATNPFLIEFHIKQIPHIEFNSKLGSRFV